MCTSRRGRERGAGDEDGRRDIARIKIARRCEGMDRAIHVLLATSEQGAGGLDCELLCAPATSRDCKGDGGVLELWAVKGCSQF